MPCYQPIPAWQTTTGRIQLHKPVPQAKYLQLRCGRCLGCHTIQAQHWALRCKLEMQQHDFTTFTTLTYDDEHKPVTLTRRHLQLWLKRLRKLTTDRLRFFASGEYGERTARPHYHAILFGPPHTEPAIHRAWGYGHTTSTPANIATIAYVAGYTAKKIGDRSRAMVEQVDHETGEVYTWQPPFIQMSRRPGLGSHARQHTHSWRLYAVNDGHKLSVPRFYHEAWKAQATEQQLQQLQTERDHWLATKPTEDLEALYAIAESRRQLAAHNRSL